MAGKVVTIAQQKGGAGKTTLAAHLAVALGQGGGSVAIVDTDPQGSLSAWVRVRAAFGAGVVPLSVRSGQGWKSGSEIDRARREADIVVVDSPPHTEQTARTVIRAADLLLVPMQLSPMDLWATRGTIDIARAAKTPSLVVLNRVSSRGRLNDEVLAELGKLDYPLAQARLGNRTVFAASLMDGLGVTEAAPSSPAAAEVAALAREVRDRLFAFAS